MEDRHETEINLEMDIADFSGKTVRRIDIQKVVGRIGSHKTGLAVVMSFVDGSTGTILIRKGEETRIVVAPYRRPRMEEYTIIEEDSVAVES
jgi:hypothetical protein